MQNVLSQAIVYATKKHEGVYRKGTKIPYILHPLEAAAIVATITTDPEIIAAAVLHDVIEDTDATEAELRRKFGDYVTDLVMSESEDRTKQGKTIEESWQIHKQDAIDRFRTASTEALIVALGDKLSNIRAIERDFAMLGDKLWERFHQPNPQKHGWYYTEIANILSQNETIKHTPAFREYAKRVKNVFGQFYR